MITIYDVFTIYLLVEEAGPLKIYLFVLLFSELSQFLSWQIFKFLCNKYLLLVHCGNNYIFLLLNETNKVNETNQVI
jgi:hypothetical protein